MGSVGQDVNFDPLRLVKARNFSTKLWNIGRLITMQLDGDNSELMTSKVPGDNAAVSLTGATLSEQWIVSKYHQQVRDVNRMMDSR